ncbi:PASTA domain-containing protein [Porphyromonas pogonae]|uniref:PASTA domain-containing protein n=1 Tax=Porphyromonas pogonae TaxID=867595 RepID=UPI002E7691DE|nr:PASTA domain-containing protein [Porphyromonas pogonae]
MENKKKSRIQGLKNSSFYTKHPIIGNILLMILLSFIIIFIVMFGLDFYTRHNSIIQVPDVKGKMTADAARILEGAGLRYEVVDSIYSDEYRKGAVVDVSPQPGHKVKPGRIVFLTINATSLQRKALPNILDMSGRQAITLLNSIGFSNVTVQIIPGEFLDLAKGVRTPSGKMLKAGDMVPIKEQLTLLVVGNVADTTAIQGNYADTLGVSEKDSLFKANADSISKSKPKKKKDENENWW